MIFFLLQMQKLHIRHLQFTQFKTKDAFVDNDIKFFEQHLLYKKNSG